MLWNEKYWDNFDNIYGTPRFIGLKPIQREKWQITDDRVSIPRALVNMRSPLYSRHTKPSDIGSVLARQEEILNHFFNIAFAIASDDVISRLLCKPLDIQDPGPFTSIESDLSKRYGWGTSENVTQPDSFFTTSKSLLAVELKLKSPSWPEQIAKYAALMRWEEEKNGSRENLGLLFVIPKPALSDHWKKLGLKGPIIDEGFFARLDRTKLPDRIKKLFDREPAEIMSVLNRMSVDAISWTWLRDEIQKIEAEVTGGRNQTLERLLTGLRDQIERHQYTEIHPGDDHGKATS
jgi:hypothetical protein